MLQPEVDHVPQLSENELRAIDERTRHMGRSIFDRLGHDRPSVFRRQWWDDQVMSWAMHDEALKVQLFRFVDVLPMLQTDAAIAEHLIEYLKPTKLPAPMWAGMQLASKYRWGHAALARAARMGARDHARRFIAGSNVAEVIRVAKHQRSAQRAFTLDILGEAVTSDVEADDFFRSYVDLLSRVSPQVNDWPADELLDKGVDGSLPRMNLSIKLSALDSQFDAVDFTGTTARVAERLRQLLRIARQQRAFINVDMESFATKDLTLHIFQQVLAEDEFRDVTDVGIAIQCYLRDADRDIQQLRDWAQSRGTPIWVRLVKGAYWDYETITATAHGWPIPVFQQKHDSDACFQRLTRFLLTNHEHLKPAFGSHNIRSIVHAMVFAEYLGLPPKAIEFQMLYGMADAEKAALVGMGYRLRVYMPYGELIPGMAYLVRRLLENTSNDSFLRASLVDHRSTEDLLQDPESIPLDTPHACHAGDPQESDTMIETTAKAWYEEFQNHPPVDFAIDDNRRQMQDAINSVREQLGRQELLWIGGQAVDSPSRRRSINPGQHQQLVGTVPLATGEHADDAVAAAMAALPDWSATPVKQRGEFLRRAAQMMRDRLFELAAWEVFECAKGWREACGDIDEAIDFCEYYALGAEVMWQSAVIDVPGERNSFQYLPRGVTAVIAPWNFPLAILTGMTVAALVTGNTVVMKPAEQAPMIAARLMEIFMRLGLPDGVLNYLPGPGDVVGARLVEHPDIALVAFTGSRQVGL